MRHIIPVSRLPHLAQDQTLLEKLATVASVISNVSTILSTIVGILFAKEATSARETR